MVSKQKRQELPGDEAASRRIGRASVPFHGTARVGFSALGTRPASSIRMDSPAKENRVQTKHTTQTEIIKSSVKHCFALI